VDVNGTRFHLVAGCDDWQQCLDRTGAGGPVDAGCDDQDGSLTLLKQLTFFLPRGRREVSLQPSARRGADFDRFGNRFWIGCDRKSIFWTSCVGTCNDARGRLFWQPAPDGCATAADTFQPDAPPPPVELAGLAVTEHHYLVVGDVSRHALLVFDLHAGGEPLLLLFPESFTPFDMAAAPGGGVWILDREHRTYWGIDRDFRVIVPPPLPSPSAFGAAAPQPGDLLVCGSGDDPARPEPGAKSGPPVGFPVDARDPVSIVALADQGVLILDGPADPASGDASRLHHLRLGVPLAPPTSLPSLAGLVDGDELRPVAGHDMAYVASTGVLYVVERDGTQSIAFSFPVPAAGAPAPPLAVRPDYLPMSAFGGRALLQSGDGVYYDVGPGTASDGTEPVGADMVIRWVELRAVNQPRYLREATLLLPVFDGKVKDCVWHRVFVDGCLPRATAVEVWTRAANDTGALDSLPFQPEPALYRRGAGAELPYYSPFPDADPPGEDSGTWELLIQEAVGRYLEVKLVLTGNGRATPRLRALRVYYPRFSYPRRYLPAVYLEEGGPASFLERLLANPEGIFTDVEGKIAAVGALFDARSAPADALDWLAGWLGLVLDPLWSKLPAAAQAGGGAIGDRRRLFIRFVLRLYARRGTPDGIRFALHLLLDPCLERLMDRLRAAAVGKDPVLCAQLQGLGLSCPTAVTSDAVLEDLLHDFVLAPTRPSQVRLVERYQTRAGGLAVAAAGDSTTAGGDGAATFADTAHRFSVLVPEGLAPEEEAMVVRVVNLEKPAHTSFDVRRYWDYFRVGEARLGLDTVLAAERRFGAMLLGRDYLDEGYLSAAHPMGVAGRLIADRDRLGEQSLGGLGGRRR
jgi:phage tail-like protein